MTTPSIDTTHIPLQFRPLMLALARGGATLAGVIRRGDGSLSGYRWGMTRKRALLDRESRD